MQSFAAKTFRSIGPFSAVINHSILEALLLTVLCMHAHAYVRICVCTRMCMCVCVHACVCVCVHALPVAIGAL